LAFADANRAQIRYIEETTFGTTPGSGTTREVRLTSSSLTASKETIVSDELRSDRMVSDIVEVAASSGGDINFEWSSGPQDEFLAAFLLNEWTRPMTMDFVEGISLSITANNEITIYGRDVTPLFVVGRRIKLAGWPTSSNDGYYEIATSTTSGADTVITVTASTLTAETGVAATRVFDANDVIILNDTTIALTASGLDGGGGDPFAAAVAAGQFVLGQKIYVDVGVSAGNTGYYTVTSVGDDAIGLSPAPAGLVAGTATTIKGSHVRNSAIDANIQQRFFSLETAFQDIGQYMLQDGMVTGTFNMEIGTGAVTGTLGFQGRSTTMNQTTTLGDAGTYTVLDSQPGDVVNATTDVGDLVKDGTPLLACIQSISLNGEAGLRMQNCVGEKFPRGIGTGRFNLTGSMTVYFEDEELFDDFINHSTTSLEFSITDPEGISYFFKIPSLKISQNEIAPGGIDQDVLENIEFTAFRDPTTDTMFQVDRFSPA